MSCGWSTRSLFGFPIHALDMKSVLDVVDESIADRKRLLIGVVNAAKLVNMRRDASLGRAVMAADMILADGMSVVWACRLLGRPVPQRVAGIDLMEEMLRHGSEKGYRVFCLGATEEVLATTVQRIQECYPGIVIAGSHHGYFKQQEEADVAARIRDARPDILFVAMTSPKKEQFLARHAETMQVPVCHGVGGAFDVLAGKVRRAPRVWQRVGMEWLYRVLQEPRRMWRRYLVTNTLFCGMVLSELLNMVSWRQVLVARHARQ